jgi:UDPglucose 6-dehydrogenase
MIKLAANAFLMTRISFINEIANVCEATGRRRRHGRRGRRARPPPRAALPARGIGWGGSCFPRTASR